MNRTCLIYMIEHRESGDAYVGSSIRERQRRSDHYSDLRHNRHHCPHLQRAFNKYGADAFDHSILETFVPKDNSHRLMVERAWIDLRGTYNVFVLDHRSGMFTITDEAKAQRSASALRRIAEHPEYREFLAERGRMLVQQLRSPEGRANIAAHTARRWQDPEERAKLAKGLENRWAEADARTIQAEKLREIRNRPEVKERHGRQMRDQWADPASGLRNRSDGRWSDPEARTRQSEKLRAAHAARRAANPKPPKPKKPKPVTMGDLILAEMRANPAGIYAPIDLRNVCDPHRIGTSTLVTVTLGRLCQRGLVRREGGGYQLA